MLQHNEGFELEEDYNRIWSEIRYEKIEELYDFTQKIIEILNSHIDDRLLFHNDYEKIQHMFKKMRHKNFFYDSKSAKKLIKSANPKFENVYKFKECKRDLKFVGKENKFFKFGKKYTSTYFNGAVYKIKIDGVEKVVGSSYLQRIS